MQGFWARYWDCPFSSYPDRTGDLRSVTKISDWYPARQWHSAGIYCGHFRAAKAIADNRRDATDLEYEPSR